jgi:Transposase IS66 family
MRGLIWWFDRALKVSRTDSTSRRRAPLRARFDRILRRRTGFVTRDRSLARLHANKPALLMVLDRPDIPLHTNGSENDIRCQVTKRKVSGGPRSDTGRDCRNAFLGRAKTCTTLGSSFWDYLGNRLAIPACQPSSGYAAGHHNRPDFGPYCVSISYVIDLTGYRLCAIRSNRPQAEIVR